jgi:hypothetical protein
MAVDLAIGARTCWLHLPADLRKDVREPDLSSQGSPFSNRENQMTTQHVAPPHPLTASLIAKRVKSGPFTPTGRRYSLLDAQLRNGAPPAFIARTVRDIEQIRRDGGLSSTNIMER